MWESPAKPPGTQEQSAADSAAGGAASSATGSLQQPSREDLAAQVGGRNLYRYESSGNTPSSCIACKVSS